MARRGEPRIPLIPVRSERIDAVETDLSTILDAAFGNTVGQVLTRLTSGWGLGSGGGGGVNPASPGQVAVYATSTTVGGVNQSSLQVLASNIIGGPIPTTTLGSGTASTTTFLRGDQTYAVPFALTTIGSSGAATFSAGTLNIPSYSGGGTPGGTSGQIQINSSGSFGGVSVITAAQVPTIGLTITQFATTIVNVTQTTGTVTFDLSQSNKQTVTLTQNATAALSNPTTGQTFTLYFIQAASGGPFTLSFFSGITWIGTSAAPTMPTTAGAILEVIFECMGTGVYYGHYLGVNGVSGGAAGTSGQIQYNSSGSLGGFTASGDATINTSTGAVAVTATGGVAFAASATTNALNASNISSGNLPTAQLPSPLYPKFGYDATNTCPQWTGIADPATPGLGNRWLSTTSNGFVSCHSSGFNVRDDGTFFECGACTALSSFTGPSSMFGSPANAKGSLTIPASFLTVGKWIELWFMAAYGTTASSPTYTFTLQVGGNTLGVSTAGTFSAGGATSGLSFGSYYGPICSIAVLATGSSGALSAMGGGMAKLNSSGAATGIGNITLSTGLAAGVTVNTTNSLLCDFLCTCSASNAANTVQILSAQWRIRG